MKITNNKLEFTENDGVFLSQLVLTAMSAKSMKDGHGPVTKFPGKEGYFFSKLHNMSFDLRTRRFEVAGEPHWYRNRFITKKVVAQVNVELGRAETQANAKARQLWAQPEGQAVGRATQLVQQQMQGAGVQQVEQWIQAQTGLTNDQMTTIREVFLPILRDVVAWPGL